jgi:hypothetical protein
MSDQSKTRVIGAFVIGFAIIAGAYTVSNFGKPSTPPPSTLSAAASAPQRVLIDVADTDTNGIEDWQDQFVKAAQIKITPATEQDYKQPDTLTGQVGISFLESIITARGSGPVGRTQEEIIADTVEDVSRFASDKIIDFKDIIISQDTSPEAIRAYGNAHADAILSNNISGLDLELYILRDILNDVRPDGMEDLEKIKTIYKGTRDDVMKIPVPNLFVKEHLDLINVYNALYNDLEAMTKALNDPMLTLVRLKRYEEDAIGLALAFRNMYLAVEPYASAFKEDDSAIFFVDFSPNLQ